MFMFFHGNDETSNRNPLISRRKPNCFGHTALFPSWNLRLLSSSLIITMIHVCARFRSFALNESSKPQASYWIDLYLTIR